MLVLHEASKRGANITIHYIDFDETASSHQGLQFDHIEKSPQTLPNNAVVIATASHYSASIYTNVSSQRSIS